MKDVLVLHYSPKRLIIAEWYNFYLSKQEPNEQLRDYAEKLKNLSKHCQLGNFLNEALRDKFVCGLKSDTIRRKLRTESNLTFERALQEAQSMAAVEDESRFLESDTVLSKLGATNSKNVPKQSSSEQVPVKSCYRGKRNHNPESCPARNWECYNCHKRGHTSRVCRKRNSVNTVQYDRSECEENSLELGFIGNVKQEHEKSCKVTLDIEGKLLNFEVDSGAYKSVIHVKDYEKELSFLEMYPVKDKLKVVTGQNVEIVGEVEKYTYTEQKPIVSTTEKVINDSGQESVTHVNPNNVMSREVSITNEAVESPISNDKNEFNDFNENTERMFVKLRSDFLLLQKLLLIVQVE
ncbi:uncharacterized protein [Diabrotica undecimpunctata]|uniref:uncharacterized protein n=1 Tax=Diabrotica undecimpunctata TaxID=50387 RepID=UPI003B6350D1